MTAWTSGEEVDEFFRIIGSYAPPPPPDAGVAGAWGEPGYAESLLGDDFELTITAKDAPWQAESADELWTEMSGAFGPIKTLSKCWSPPARSRSRRSCSSSSERRRRRGGLLMSRPYVLIHGVRRGSARGPARRRAPR